MEKFGKNLRRRARDLDLSDADVARRAGLSPRRYSFYVTGDREPDLATFVRIAEVLQISTDELLGVGQATRDGAEGDLLLERLMSAATHLPPEHKRLLVVTAEAFGRDAEKRRNSDNSIKSMA